MGGGAAGARMGGGVGLRYYGKGTETAIKSAGSPVRIAGLSAEHAAREWIERQFPEDGIIGEELPPVRGGASRRWILDPIDGTFTFLQGAPLWGTLVAVAECEQVIAGAAFFPALDEIIVAAQGEGCWWNGARARVSSVSELAEARLLTTDARFMCDPARRESWLRLQDSVGSMRTGGDCYGCLLVATGRAEIMVDDVMSAWDCAALMPIITEAGGVFTDWRGRATAFGGDAIATNAELASVAREILAASVPVSTGGRDR